MKVGLPRRVLVATDGSPTAGEAVRWAASLASQNDAELVLVRVLEPGSGMESVAAEELSQLALESAGSRGKARLLSDGDAARAIVRAAEEENADLVVVGSAGMAGRKTFLLENVPNRVSHLSARNVAIVKTGHDSSTAAKAASSLKGGRAKHKPYLVSRLKEIALIARKHRLEEGVQGGLGDAAARRAFGRRLRLALDELGPTFAKIGQVLSTRPDLLPPEIIEELTTLQDAVSPLTQEKVVEVMESELGVPWEDVFESIDPRPLAAGTIAQVHRATLADGTRVVVKVQRPTARVAIERDLELIRAFADRADKRAVIKRLVDVKGVVDHLSSSLVRELDFRLEAKSLTRMREVLESYPRLGVPALYSELSTSRVLVLEEVLGLPTEEVPAGDARTQAARQLLESYFHQVVGAGFFHADPHPGNFVWRDERLYFLDFGMVGEIDDHTRELLMLLLFATWRNDPGLLADVALLLSGGAARVGPGFEKELGELLARYHNAPLAEISLGVVLQEMTKTALRHGVRMPASLALASKALAQMQLAAADLDPTLDPVAVAGSFVSRLLLERLRETLDPGKVVSEFMRFGVRTTRLVEAVENLSGSGPGQGPEINLRGIGELEKSIRQAGRRVAIGVGFAGLLVAAALSTRVRVPGMRK